jgi:putative glycosyltransferase (TIGR04372 family)
MIAKFVENIKKSNRLVAGGMFFFNSPGHMLAESDYLLRKLIADAYVRQRSPIVFLPPTPFTAVTSELLKIHDVTVVFDPSANLIAREIQFFYPELVLDVGVAHFKLTTPPPARGPVCRATNMELAWALRRDELTAQWVRLCKLWNATRGHLPLREAIDKLPCDPEFQAILLKGKYAVLQIKSAIVNGTVRVLPPQHFRPTLEMLRDKGYSVILAGREPMPEEFKRYDVFDYPASKFASPKNDFFLFRHASLGIASPSGAGYFCDALGIPLCQYAPWTLQPHPSEKTIMVPSRIRKRTSPAILTFTQQIGAFLENYDEVKGPGVYHPTVLEDIPPSPEDICAGVQELIDDSIRTSAVARQQADTIRSLDKGGMWGSTASTIASSFLSNHPEYLA